MKLSDVEEWFRLARKHPVRAAVLAASALALIVFFSFASELGKYLASFASQSQDGSAATALEETPTQDGTRTRAAGDDIVMQGQDETSPPDRTSDARPIITSGGPIVEPNETPALRWSAVFAQLGPPDDFNCVVVGSSQSALFWLHGGSEMPDGSGPFLCDAVGAELYDFYKSGFRPETRRISSLDAAYAPENPPELVLAESTTQLDDVERYELIGQIETAPPVLIIHGENLPDTQALRICSYLPEAVVVNLFARTEDLQVSSVDRSNTFTALVGRFEQLVDGNRICDAILASENEAREIIYPRLDEERTPSILRLGWPPTRINVFAPAGDNDWSTFVRTSIQNRGFDLE